MANLFRHGDYSQVIHLKKGSEKAFDYLFRKYSYKVYLNSCELNLDHAEAEEVVQEVFLQIWKNRANLDANRSFKGYIQKVSKSIIIKKIRAKVYQTAYEKYALNHFPSSTNQTEDYLIFSDLEAISRKYLEQLPKKQKQVFMMKVQENRTLDEIAKTLQVSKRTVENHLYRACKSLRSKIAAT